MKSSSSSRGTGPDRLLCVGCGIVVVALALSAGCASRDAAIRPEEPAKAEPTPVAPREKMEAPATPERLTPHWNEQVIDNGWLTVRVALPFPGTSSRPNGPHPVVLNPTLPDHMLLENGIAVAHWKSNWEALKALQAARDPKGSPPSMEVAESPDEEGVGQWMLRAPRAGIVGRGYFRFITTEARRSLPSVVDHLLTLPELDPGAIAIAGNSTGGFIALQAMADDRRLAVGVVQVACGDYREFLRTSSLALDGESRWLNDGQLALDEDYEAEVESIEPVRRATEYPPRPLLLLSGALDRAIPQSCVRAGADAFIRAYEEAGVGDRFVWIEFPDKGHDLGEGAQRAVLSFLLARLLGEDR